MIRAPRPAGLATAGRPIIVSFQAKPAHDPIPAAGAPVKLSVRVRNGATCTFLRQHSTFSSLYAYRTVNCRQGRANVTIPPIANPYKADVTLTYAVRVKGAGGHTVQRSVMLLQKAAPKPKPKPAPAPTPAPPAQTEGPTADLTLQPTSVPSNGGSVTAIFASGNATNCTLAASPALWSDAADPRPVDCNGSSTLVVPANAAGGSWTISFTAANASGTSAVDTQSLTEEAQAPPPPKPNLPTGAQFSTNWSGYFVGAPSIIAGVSGRWTAPPVNCASTPNAGGSVWVGLGGMTSSDDLLQTGIRMSCNGGSAEYAAWWEQYPPLPSYEFTGLPISPGDQMWAVVNQASNGQWQTRIDDVSSGISGVYVANVGWGLMPDNGGNTFTLQGRSNLGYDGGTSAEWIVEAYYDARAKQQVPLVNYGTVSFSDLRTTVPSWYLTGSNAIAMVQNGSVVSTPSEASGSSFQVTYTGP